MVLELELGESKLPFTIVEAHDPEPFGDKEDRSPRKNSLVKNFKAVEMGVIELEKGTGELALKATGIPGEGAIDFRLLFLTRVEQ